MGRAMTKDDRNATHEHRRLVQRILAGGIPEGKEFDACRAILQTRCGDDEALVALFTLLEGALADPFFDIQETQRVVPILKALARGEIGVRELV
jgi:hypothetical protein